METLSTAGLPAAGRTAAWNALYASRMSRVGFMPRDQSHFDAELRIGQLGPVKLARLSVDSCSIERSPGHIVHPSPRLYSFMLQTQGQSTFHHCGNEAHLSEGDFVLCDTGQPHYWSARDPSTIIMVRVEPALLREYLPTPELFCGQRLGHAVGLTDTVAAMVRSLAQRVETGIDAPYEEQVARHLLKMLSMNYAMGFGDGSAAGALRLRHNDIVRHVEDHLRDPQLTPASVAEALRLSPRYLRTIFSISGERLSAYILRRRLEECARQLGNPGWNAHTLAEIAFSWGFNSPAYFTRCFRDRFGVAPGDYRRPALQDRAED
ncbi:MAG: helix-turn-helix domain-containing protein [Sphingomonadales bacterium]|nr:helix-turn-helix domain-containing protein [Sphingomonadales bacterium]